MEQYPTIARPSLTREFAAEFNSVSQRYGKYTELRDKNVRINPMNEYDLFKKNYYRDGYRILIESYKNELVTIEPENVLKWIKKHNYPTEVVKCLETLLDEGWERHRMNDVEIHSKVEQTTKLDKLSRWYDEVVSRTIAAGSYALSAIFADAFVIIKKRFKDALKLNVFYSDGCTPEQLNAKLNTMGDFEYAVEDDLSQQDRQTTMEIIEVERLIYKDLGLDEDVLNFYLLCHHKWQWKGRDAKGSWDAMRLTGQVTTAIGNAITNLIVHNRFFSRNEMYIKLMAFLGDDNIMLCDRLLDVKNHGTEVKALYNMVSKVSQKKRVGGFLSMLVHSINGKAELCPHYKRLRHRYSVCNYSYDANTMVGKIDSRTLSYCLMLGNIKTTKQIAQTLCPEITVPDWYNVNAAIVANSIFDESSEENVLQHLGYLAKMMSERNVHTNVINHWVSE